MSTSPPRRLRPLNVGNVVSAGISLFRAHFKTYLGLSVKGILWLFVPVYGWARGPMIFGQISRLGFKEVCHQPETVGEALQEVEPRIWSFLGVGILVFIIQLIAAQIIAFIGGIFIAPLVAFTGIGGTADIIAGIIQVVGQLLIFVAQTWVQARFCLYQIIIAVETDKDATSSISRSWELTQGNAARVLSVLLVAYLVVAPLYILAFAPFLFTIPFLADPFSTEASMAAFFAAFLLALLVCIVVLILASVLVNPFWQSIMSVLYYDLRSRREGFDIQLSKRIEEV
ncbi:MAG: hypothetical protein AAGH78_03070 [Cyanobacteria bacterium P01_H01_bin.58]